MLCYGVLGALTLVLVLVLCKVDRGRYIAASIGNNRGEGVVRLIHI
jgi:hypothetical protein